MKVLQTAIIPYALPLRQALPSAAGGGLRREGLLLAIDAGSGSRAYGDVAPLPGVNRESLVEARTALGRVEQELRARSWPDAAADLLAEAAASFAWAPASVRCGAETALLNAWSHAHAQPWHLALGRPTLARVRVNALVSGPATALVAAASAAAGSGYRCIKVKVGHLPAGEVAAVVRDIAGAVGADVTLRLDANRAWSVDEAVVVAEGLGKCRIEYLEEPLRPGGDLRVLRRRCALRLAVDESLVDGDSSGADVWVIKPTRLGGVAATLARADLARRCGVTVVISSAFESDVGLRALFQLAALTHAADTAAGLATGAWLARDVVAEPLRIADGICDLGEVMQMPTRLVAEVPT